MKPKKFTIINRFFDQKIEWIGSEPLRGMRSVKGYLPLTRLEAETFQVMLTQNRHSTMTPNSMYLIEDFQ